MNLFDERGSYNYTSFKGSNGIWRLVGTEVQGEGNYQERFLDWWDTSMGLTLDTFKSEKDLYTTYTRARVYQFWKARQIIPVEASVLIKMGSGKRR